MISKQVTAAYWDFDLPAARILNVYSKGLDKCQLDKMASEQMSSLRSDITPEKGYSFVHVITNGAGEYYGCFPEGTLVWTEYGLKPIETIQENEHVVTHKQRLRPVLKTFKKTYTDDFIEIRPSGFALPVTMTKNHPVLVIRKEQIKDIRKLYYRQKINRSEYARLFSELPREFVRADTICKGDFVLVPTQARSAEAEKMPLPIAYLAGLYAAEGCKGYNAYDPNKRQSLIYVMGDKDVGPLYQLEQCYAQLSPNIIDIKAPLSNGNRNIFRVTLRDTALASTVLYLCGEYSTDKRLAPCIFEQSEEWRLNFLAGYLDGDGCIHTQKTADPRYTGTVTFSTASVKLAEDIQRLCFSLQIPCSLNLCHNRESNGCLGKGDMPIYSGCLGSVLSSKVCQYTHRLKYPDVKKTNRQTQPVVFLPTGETAVGVAEIKVRPNTSTDVYNIEVEEDNTYVTGFSVHNSNSNGDYFNENACTYNFPHPARGIDKVAHLDGGLKKYHSTYTQMGGVYRNHRNSRKKDPATGNPFEKEGTIRAETYNDKMHRGELIVKLPDNKWGDVLEKLASGKPVFWSMAAAVPADICSYCGNKASSRAKYCSHLKNMMNKIAEDGHAIHAINDTTYYHDISEVAVPAAKIAFTLEKVASGETCRKPELVEQGLWLPEHVVKRMVGAKGSNRYDMMQKLAKIEKIVKAVSLPKEQDFSDAFTHSTGEEMNLADKLQGIPLEDLLSLTMSKKMLLPPRTFTIIVIRNAKPPQEAERYLSEPAWLDALPGKLSTIFSDLENSEELDDVLTDGSYSPCHSFPEKHSLSRIQALEPEMSLEPEPVRRRLIVKVIKPSARIEKTASLSPYGERLISAMSKEYAKYQLAFLEQAGEQYVPFVVQNNQAC